MITEHATGNHAGPGPHANAGALTIAAPASPHESDPFKTLPPELLQKITRAVDQMEHSNQTWASHALVNRDFRAAFRNPDIRRNQSHFWRALWELARHGRRHESRVRELMTGVWAQGAAPGLTELTLDGRGFEVMDCMSSFVNLRRLCLRFVEICEVGLEALGQFSELTWLDLSRGNLFTEDLQHLTSLTRLNHLIVANTNLDNSGLAVLARLPALEGLNLYSCCGVDSAGFMSLSQASALSYLHWSKDDASEADISALGSLHGLRTLVLEDFYTVYWSQLTCLQQLWRLQINAFGLTLEKLSFLSALGHLEELEVAHLPHDSDCLKPFRGLTSLRSLHVNPGRLTQDGLSALHLSDPLILAT